jgi:hypothetical protein
MFLIPEGGWFWYIPLPDDIMSVGIVADPDYLFGAGGTPEAIFEREVTRCATLSERLTTARRVGPVRGLRQLAYRQPADLWRWLGDDWRRARVSRSDLFLRFVSGAGSAELAAGCIESALTANDFSAARLGAFEPALWDGVDSVRRLIYAFYDPKFSFREFAERFPDQRRSLIDCLVGDVIKDMSAFKNALAQMTPPPPPLSNSVRLSETVVARVRNCNPITSKLSTPSFIYASNPEARKAQSLPNPSLPSRRDLRSSARLLGQSSCLHRAFAARAGNIARDKPQPGPALQLRLCLL